MERHTVKVRTDGSVTVPASCLATFGVRVGDELDVFLPSGQEPCLVIKNPRTESLFTSEIEKELDLREAEVEANGVADSKVWRATGRVKKAAAGKR